MFVSQCEHVFARIVIVLLVSVLVEAGETLWSIASARYGGDPRAGVWKLQQANGLSGTQIVPGQRLLLP